MEEKHMYCFSWQHTDSFVYREAFVVSTDDPVEFTKALKVSKCNVFIVVSSSLVTNLKIWKFENGSLVELSVENIRKAVNAASEYIRLANDLDFQYKKIADLNQQISDHYKEMAKLKDSLGEIENGLPKKIGE